MSQPDNAVDRAFSRLCIAVIKSASQDLKGQGYSNRGSAYTFFHDADSMYPVYRDFLSIEFPGVRMDCIPTSAKGDE